MKKILLSLLLGVLLLGIFTVPVQAATLLDDFNDGNTNGWWLGYSMAFPSIYGNWRTEDGTLVQDLGYDGTIALLNDFQVSSQAVETKLRLKGPSGYGGIVIWFKENNGVFIGVRSGAIGVSEVTDGIWSGTEYPFNFNINENRWVDLRVEVNSESGDLNVYADDIYLFSHHLATAHRNGQSGVYNGNAGGYFDDFRVFSNDIPPVIDIRPRGDKNIINLRGEKNVPVAILSATNFSAPLQIDRTTLTFGKSGNENSLENCFRKSKDLNRDGILDLECIFITKLMGFKCGDSEGILKGKISSTGIMFETKQSIKVVPCKRAEK